MNFESILIVTYGRTGSTLLQGLLNSIPGTLIRGENNNICTGLFIAYKSLITTIINEGKLEQDITMPFYGADKLNESAFITDARSLLLHQLVPDGLNTVKCWGFKEIRYIPNTLKFGNKYELRQYLDFLVKLLPKPAIIFLTRDHESVSDSAFWRTQNKSNTIEQLEMFEREANIWSRDRPDSYWIDYKNIIDRDIKLVGLFDFLGSEYNKQDIERVMSREHSHRGKQENLAMVQRRKPKHDISQANSQSMKTANMRRRNSMSKAQNDRNKIMIDIYTSSETVDEQFSVLINLNGKESAANMLADAILAAVNSGKAWQVKKVLNARCLSPDSVGNFAMYVRFHCKAGVASEQALQVAEASRTIDTGSFGWNNLVEAEMLLAGKRVDEALLALHYQAPDNASCDDLVCGNIFVAQVAMLTARALVASGRYDEAHRILDTALETTGNRAALFHTKGNTARAQGNKWLTTACYLDAVENDPGFVPAYFGLLFGLEKTPTLWKRGSEILERACAEQSGKVPKPAFAALHRLYELQGYIDKATSLNCRYVDQMTQQKLKGQSHPSANQHKESRLDFLIVGAQKCGTSSLFSWLGHHPASLLPHTKEIGFFATERYSHGLEWYLSHFSPLCDQDDYFSGESTPIYFGRTNLASRQIKQALQSVKIIMLLRNPASRTLSAYFHRVKMGKMKDMSMQDAIDSWISEYQRSDISDLDNTNPVAISVYAPRVRKWFDTFGRENCLVLNADDLFADPTSIMPQVYSFLGIENVNISYGVANAGTYKKGGDYELMRNRLQEFFTPSIIELEKLIQYETKWLTKA